MKIEERAHLRRETREVTVDLEVRDSADGGLTFEGFATTYGQPYAVEDFLGSYQEEFDAGSFNKSLKMKVDVPLLINHAGLPLARTSSGTLELASTSVGLRARATLEPLDPDVASIQYKMKRGDLNKMSIAFRAVEQEWSPNWDYRRITEAELFDVSVVTTPANPNTSAGLRSIDAALVDEADLSVLVARFYQIDETAARAALEALKPAEEPTGPTIEALYLRHFARAALDRQ